MGAIELNLINPDQTELLTATESETARKAIKLLTDFVTRAENIDSVTADGLIEQIVDFEEELDEVIGQISNAKDELESAEYAVSRIKDSLSSLRYELGSGRKS